MKLPESISALYYDSRDVFKVIMAIAVLASAIGGLYVASAMFALVYIFRTFMNRKHTYIHYGAAIAAFVSASIGIGTFTPVLIGAVAGGIALLLKQKSYLFIFEVVASILILIKLYA